MALFEAGAIRALDLVHHIPRNLRVERPLQHHLRLGVPRVDREVVEPPILFRKRYFWMEIQIDCTSKPYAGTRDTPIPLRTLERRMGVRLRARRWCARGPCGWRPCTRSCSCRWHCLN